jgi:glyoxylase-like metal-dependent hydrolase (beta-lactamase superfamily II)
MGEGARLIHAPGHADNQLLLHEERRGLLFAADHLLLVITPNIGLWPESEPHPLTRYLDSLYGLRGLDGYIILPAHGPVFHDLDGRIEELLRHHEERLDLMRRVIESGPKTPYAVSREVFQGAVTPHQRCFALAEPLAHLEHLVLEGGVRRRWHPYLPGQLETLRRCAPVPVAGVGARFWRIRRGSPLPPLCVVFVLTHQDDDPDHEQHDAHDEGADRAYP